MKRLFTIVLIGVLALPSMVAAQDLTETYSDEQISFAYPTGWYTSLDPEDHGVTLSNVPIDEDNNELLEAKPGAVQLIITAWIPEEFGDTIHIQPRDPRFLAGFYAGLLAGIVQIVGGFSGETPTITIDDLEESEIDGQSVYSVEFETSFQGQGGAKILVIMFEGALLTATAPAAEFEQWQDTIWAIAETVQLP